MTHFDRSEWGARAAEPGPGLLTPARVRGIALHWPATPTRLDTVPEVKAALRGWQDYHMDGRGWSDIAYQLAVDQLGNSYGLRGLRYRSAANGGTLVNQTYGAMLLVLAPGEAPSPELIATARRFIGGHQQLFTRSRLIVGHGDIRPEPTACPGPLVTQAIRAGRFTPTGK